jgi:hypothetical protein
MVNEDKGKTKSSDKENRTEDPTHQILTPTPSEQPVGDSARRWKQDHDEQIMLMARMLERERKFDIVRKK